jgi:hypothetical protein
LSWHFALRRRSPDRYSVDPELQVDFALRLGSPTTGSSRGAEAFAANGDPKPVTRGQVLELAEGVVEHKGLVFAPHATRAAIAGVRG